MSLSTRIENPDRSRQSNHRVTPDDHGFSDLIGGAKPAKELALLPLNLCEEAIKIAEVRHVSLYAGYISSDLLYRRSQLRIPAPRYEDVLIRRKFRRLQLRSLAKAPPLS